MTSKNNTACTTRLICTMSILLFSLSVVAVSSNAQAKSETNSKIKAYEKRISRTLKAGARSVKKECGIKKLSLDYKILHKLPLADKMEEIGRVEGIVDGIVGSYLSICSGSQYKNFDMKFVKGKTWRVKASSGKIIVMIGYQQPYFSGVGKMLSKKL